MVEGSLMQTVEGRLNGERYMNILENTLIPTTHLLTIPMQSMTISIAFSDHDYVLFSRTLPVIRFFCSKYCMHTLL